MITLILSTSCSVDIWIDIKWISCDLLHLQDQQGDDEEESGDEDDESEGEEGEGDEEEEEEGEEEGGNGTIHHWRNW